MHCCRVLTFASARFLVCVCFIYLLMFVFSYIVYACLMIFDRNIQKSLE